MSGPAWATPGPSPWADPSSPTELGAPYAGPPPTAPHPYAAQPYAPQPWGAPAWGPIPYGYPLPPRPPQRPGQVITAAVLTFTQSLVVVIVSLYLWFIASIADVVASSEGISTPAVDGLAAEGSALAIVQLFSAVLLIGAGVWALNSRRRPAGVLLIAALGLQVVLAVYWAVRLNTEVGGFDTEGAIAVFALFFAAAPLVGIGLLLVGPGRRWFDSTR